MHPNFAKIHGDWKSRLHKQSLPPQAKPESAQADLVCIAPDFRSVGDLLRNAPNLKSPKFGGCKGAFENLCKRLIELLHLESVKNSQLVFS